MQEEEVVVEVVVVVVEVGGDGCCVEMGWKERGRPGSFWGICHGRDGTK